MSSSTRRRRLMRLFVIVLVLLALGPFVLSALSWGPQSERGLVDGRLRACPDSPNCVCSQSPSTAPSFVEPIRFKCDPEEALRRVRAVIAAMPRAHVTADADGYLHVEFVTAWLRFVDDFELLIDAEAKLLHVRSASRIGYSDLGVNRARVDDFRKRFAAVESDRR